MMARKQVEAKALKQLNEWSQSSATLKLIVSAGPLRVWYVGHLSKLTDLNIFFFKPNEGGGAFEFSPSQCPPVIQRTDIYTTVSFREERVALNLLEWFGDPPSKKARQNIVGC
jgi:hypothetical protein